VFLKLPFEVRKEPEGSSGKGGWWVREMGGARKG